MCLTGNLRYYAELISNLLIGTVNAGRDREDNTVSLSHLFSFFISFKNAVCEIFNDFAASREDICRIL